jgi:UDP-GlcNAc:undecaprenyl-phosphate/decaprenyl-phosphate GlcNAc-1-phosphate transferase
MVSGVLTALLIRWAPRLGLVDLPDPRKVHTQPTPRAGGLAIVAGVAAGVALFPFLGLSDALSDPRWRFGPAIVLLGLLDDLRPLPWQLRLGVQFIVAGLAVCTGLPVPEGPIPGWLFQTLAILWTVGLINAFNMLDNMDLLSGGTAFIVCGCLAGTSLLGGPPAWPALVLAGALAGFLPFNRPQRCRSAARIFMGDSGSTFLGFFLALGTARLVPGSSGPFWLWAVPPCLMAVPLYDLTTVVLLRLRQGRSPFHPDKQHLSHRLVAAGLRPPAAVGLIHLLALATGVSGLLLYRVSSAIGAILLGIQIVLWWLGVASLDWLVTRRWFLREPE